VLVGVTGFEPVAPRSQTEVRPSVMVRHQRYQVRVGGLGCGSVGGRCGQRLLSDAVGRKNDGWMAKLATPPDEKDKP